MLRGIEVTINLQIFGLNHDEAQGLVDTDLSDPIVSGDYLERLVEITKAQWLNRPEVVVDAFIDCAGLEQDPQSSSFVSASTYTRTHVPT